MLPFASGLSAAFSGLLQAMGNADVRRAYGRVVGAILLLTTAVDIAAIWALLWPVFDGPELGWTNILLRILATIISLLLAPFVAIVLTNLAFPMFNVGPFMALLRSIAPDRARELEALPGLPLRTSAVASLIRLARFLGLAVLAFAISLIPVVGPVVGPGAQIYFSAQALGWELLDPYLDKLGLDYTQQKRFVREHRGALLGFGLPYAFVFAIPLLGPLIFGFAQAAAALLVVRTLEAADPQPPAVTPR